MRIQQLPPAIANQIAAGEVIERPASVVKELLENSLDAGADLITVEIGYGGLNQIKVSDNGMGIVAEDLPLAVAAHATSKITTLDDLYAIDSMGFRGEALASIASVAKVAISSRPVQQEHAMLLRAQDSKCTLVPCARNVGTTVDVVDLFFNAPVRKRFLKNEKLEFQAIEVVIKRFALSAPHIGLSLKHNNKLVLSLPAAINEQAKQTRMAKIFGSAFIKDAIYLDTERGAMRLSGWVSGPNYQRSQNDRQWVYINQRMVKDKLINHALKQAYDGWLYPGRFPACLLYLTIHTAEVDVNVHPTKHEVRFQQPRLVHDFFTSQLSDALKSGALKNEERVYEYNSCSASAESTDIREPYLYPNHLSATEAVRILSSSAPSEEELKNSSQEQKGFSPRTCLLAPWNNGSSRTTVSRKAAYPAADESSWVILNNQYILVFLEQQPHLVDLIALQKKWLLEQLSLDNLPLESRPLLVPVSYAVSPKLKERMNELQSGVEPVGIRMEWSKEDKLLIRTIPIKAPYLDIRLFVESVITLESLQLEQLIQVISQCQRFDFKLLSVEERMELNRFLLSVQHQGASSEGIYKILSVDDCRMLLHV